MSSRFREEIEKALKEGKAVIIESKTARSEIKVAPKDKDKVKIIRLEPPT